MSKRNLFATAFCAALFLLAGTALATDTDSDGLSDAFEQAFGTSHMDADTDGDTWSDYAEVFGTGTDATKADTDGDGFDDNVDSDPHLLPSGDQDGGSAVARGGFHQSRPDAFSGESAKDGMGVYAHSGELIYSLALCDSKAPGPNPIPWATYRSQMNADTVLGWNWMNPFEIHYSVDQATGDVSILGRDGVFVTYTDTGSGFDPPGYDPRSLEEDPSGDEYTRTSPNGFIEHFADGVLDYMEDRFGNQLDFTHNGAGQVTSMTDERGEQHVITYYSTGRIKTIAMADGRTWTFLYNTYGQLHRIEGPNTTSFATGIDWEFRYTKGSQDPDLNHNLIAVFDGKGQGWMTAEYDASDRVVEQKVGEGFFEFDYSDIANYKTTVTDRVDNERVWEWHSTKLTRKTLTEKSNRDVRSTDPTSWLTEWTHDGDGYLIEVEFPEGNGIEWTLNSVKLPTERRHKTDVDAADSDTNDLIHTWTYDSAKYYALSSYADPRQSATASTTDKTSYTLNTDGQTTKITYEDSSHVSPAQEDIEKSFAYVTTGDLSGMGLLRSVTDEEGTVTRYEYWGEETNDPQEKDGLVKKVIVDYGTGKLNLTTQYDYEDWGQLNKVTDPEGNVTEYTIEYYTNVTKIKYPTALGYETSFTHDANLNVTGRYVKNIDENGVAQSSPADWRTDYTYTVMDKIATTKEYTDATNYTEANYFYDANNNLVTFGKGNIDVDMTYDERDLLYERVRDQGTGQGFANQTEKHTYDKNRNLVTYENGRGKKTTFEYDLFDRRTKSINANGHYEQLVYDKNGNVTERKWYEEKAPSADVLMAHEKRTYDELNRFYKEEAALIDTTTTWYDRKAELDKRGRMTKWTDRESSASTFVYDAAGRWLSRTDALGNKVEWTYDDNGNVTKVKETEKIPGSQNTEIYETEFTFDAINRRTKQTVIDRTESTNKKITEWKWSSRNVVAELVDPKGYKTNFVHDGLGRMTKKTEDLSGADDIVTEWTYDDNGNVTQLKDDNANTTDYEYDKLNRLKEKTYDDLSTVTYAYDKADNLTNIVDRAGNDIDLGYDDINRLTARDATLASGWGGDTNEDFTYDPMNRMTEAKDDNSIVQFTYDSLSRVTSETQGDNPLASSGKTVDYTYDKEGNRTQIDYPSGFEAHRTYDAIDRLTLIEDINGTDIADFDLHGAGGRRKQLTFGNSSTSSYTFDGFRRPIDISHEDSGSTEFASFTYGWDKNDNPLYEERGHQYGMGDVYTYDQANRLVKVLQDCDDPSAEVASPGTEMYVDKVDFNMDDVLNFTSLVTTPYGGGPTTVSYTTNGMNAYTDVGGTTHTYDDNGNLADDGINEYDYDWRGHLIKVTDKASSTTVAEYDYDCYGLGRRTHKVVGSDTTQFVYADQQCVEEYDGSGTLLRKFAFGDGLDEVVFMEAPDVADVDGDANTTELMQFYFHTQLIGSVTQVTDPLEVVVESYDYGPYGETAIADIYGSPVGTSQIGNPFLYTGRRLDEESGLYYYRARHYSPELRRFIQRDPLEYVDGPNAYAYVGTAPLKRRDPLGLHSGRDGGRARDEPDGDPDNPWDHQLHIWITVRCEESVSGGDVTNTWVTDAAHAKIVTEAEVEAKVVGEAEASYTVTLTGTVSQGVPDVLSAVTGTEASVELQTEGSVSASASVSAGTTFTATLNYEHDYWKQTNWKTISAITGTRTYTERCLIGGEERHGTEAVDEDARTFAESAMMLQGRDETIPQVVDGGLVDAMVMIAETAAEYAVGIPQDND